jgi:uncharacterized protein (DUF4415 family)
MKLRPNPYSARLKKSITIRLDTDVLDYFKSLAEQKNVPYQTLLNDFLRSCKEQNLIPETVWKKAG